MRLLSILLLAGFVACANAAPSLTDVAYGPEPEQRFDLHAPPGAQAAPLILMVHGGGWIRGDEEMGRVVDNKVSRWLPRGIAFVSINYRMQPKAPPLEQARDVARALAYVEKNSARLGVDRSNIVLMGHSAGAHIATLLALDGDYLAAEGLRPAGAVRGVVGLAGPYDFLPLRSRTLQAIFGPESTWPASQPVNHVARGAPPMLLATGDADSTVLPRNTESLAARLRAADNPVRTLTYPGIGHREILGAFAPGLRFLAPVRQDVLRFVAATTA